MSRRARILVVDDEPLSADMMARALRKLGSVEQALSGEEAWRMVRRADFDLVLSDQRMPGMSGVELLSLIAKRSLRTGRVLVTAYAEMADTISAINQGQIHAYLSKPCSPPELRATAQSVLDLLRRYSRPSTPLLGESPGITEVRERIAQVAAVRFPVLILGETGTGKELVARSIHASSPRSDGPFVAVNCGALPESLLESELFGHAQGAFTGADTDRPGLFELADGGTLFLDEIGDTSPALQIRLLRILEAGEVRRVGDNRTRSVDVRLVSATHRDIEAMMKEGEFRQDLFYRINTIVLHIPPLRARREDIGPLAEHFAANCGEVYGREISLAADALKALAQMQFPGNVRELRSVLERGIAVAGPESVITAEHLVSGGAALGSTPVSAAGTVAAGSTTLKDRVEAVQIQAIREALEQFDGNRTRAAELLGLSRPGLTKMMRRLGLEDTGDR